MSTIRSLSAEIFDTPLHTIFVTSQGSAMNARGVAIILTLNDGSEVRGEAVPVTYVTGETRESVLAAVAKAEPELRGMKADDYGLLMERVEALLPDEPSARCGLEMALLLAWSRTRGISLRSLWGGVQTQAETDITLSISPDAPQRAAEAWERGIRLFKMKVGDPDREADLARVRAIRKAVPEAEFRIDANQAFTPEEALRFTETLVNEGTHLQLLEQPVGPKDIEGLIWVAERSPVPVFADESCRTRAEALRLADTPVQGYNLKINKCGIQGALDIIAIARSAGKKLMIGCMLETRFSISISLALACGTGAFQYLDLDGHLLLKEPGPNPCFREEGGWMLLPE